MADTKAAGLLKVARMQRRWLLHMMLSKPGAYRNGAAMVMLRTARWCEREARKLERAKGESRD